ncbi:MerR family transcriptional regulator [Bowdeniella massiliensis]|uniref:MerR family transcriptional regulator n=1 Tax=Bowdeniella massiliensis TaxID=2932264 RepID=UPI002028F1EC|nr:MerR family transcriptional regulator [Bowdeniella massiliensis]
MSLPDDTEFSVGQSAEILKVTVRTLHHWDAIGLVRPSGRTYAGYRRYSHSDLQRAQHALIYRETGMSLAQIGELLDSGTPVAAHLQHQRDLLAERLEGLHQMIAAIDRILGHDMNDETAPLTVAEKAEILGSSWSPDYEVEAEERWGETTEWALSHQRQASLTKEDWRRVKAELEELEARLAEAMRRGVVPGSPEAHELAEAHRANISQWFDVSHAQHVLIARGYVADPRFRAHYDERAEGLAAWLKAIIDANAAAHGVDPEAARWQ